MQLRNWYAIVVALALGLSAGCTRRDPARSNEPAAKQAGREAYHASQDIKRGAREAAHEIREAGKEFRDGWSQARHDPPPQRDDKDKRPAPDRRNR